MIDRKTAPLFKEVSHLELPKSDYFELDNGIPVHQHFAGTQDILKLEIVFNAGRPFEDKKLAGRATARMLKEGTLKHSSAQIAELVDFYGASVSMPVNLDTSNIIVYSLRKHFPKLLPLVAEIILEPSFPENELQAFINNSKQSLEVDLARNEVLAYRKITELIFGAEHPYGYNSFYDTYEALTIADVEHHFEQKYSHRNCNIFISGKGSAAEQKLLNQYLGQFKKAEQVVAKPMDVSAPISGQLKIDRPNSLQTAIRIGRKLFNRSHPDYKGMFVLNTILGGFFGSRLMANIREDKGFTYHIFSTIDPLLYNGCFYIGTEVGTEYVEQTIAEIYKEIRLLREELIGTEEMKMVKNYLLGNMLNMLDGAFNTMEVLKIIHQEKLSTDDFPKLIQTIRNITPEQLQQLAIKYLNPNELWQVVVGK